MKQIRDETIEIVRAAGRAIMSYYRGAYDVQDKSPDNPVTDADLAADTLLKKELLALLPEAGWLSEETVDNPDRLDKSMLDRKSTRLNSSHSQQSRMPSSA